MKKQYLVLLLFIFLSCILYADVTIYEIQYTTDPSGDSPYANQNVTTSGIVTGTGFAGFDDSFFISMPEGGAWKGLYCYNSDLEAELGDEVEVTGEITEYYGLTEMTYGSVTILSSGNTIPLPVTISTDALASEEMYEGVLVIINNVTVIELPDTHGQWYVDDGSGECQIDDGFYEYPNPQMGISFYSIAGLVDYNWDEYGLHPRDLDDFQLSGEDTTPPELVSAFALTATSVNLQFSEEILQATAEEETNYEISGLDILAAVLQTGGTTVLLTTSEQIPAQQYTITVNNIEDLNQNVIDSNSTIIFTGYTEGGDDATVFFSEYIEGSSNNKALEIYNGSGSDIDLSDYRIAQSANGNGWEYFHEWSASTILTNGDVWVITTDTADSALQDVADEILPYPSVVHFNGNDARALERYEGGNWEIIDVIGVPDENPGDGWDVAGVSDATYNHTLVRKSEIEQGNTDWDISAGTNADNSEWIVYDQDTFEYIGFHSSGGDDIIPPVLINANALTSTSVEVTYNEAVDEETAETISNYSISPTLNISAAQLTSSNKVTLTTAEQIVGENYTLTVNNVEDLAGNIIDPGSTVNFSGYEMQDYTPIADIQNDPEAYEGETVTISGVVTIGVNVVQEGLTNAFVQDNSDRGINIYDSSVITDLTRGNLVEITGIVEEYTDSYGNTTTEITNPDVTVLATGQPEPNPTTIDISNNQEMSLEGTLVKVTGTIYEIYSAGGGTNLNISDDENNEMTIRIWDTTGIDLSEFFVGFILEAVGVGSEYDGYLQILTGYQDQLNEGQLGGYDDVLIEPLNPVSGEPVNITFYNDADNTEDVFLFWRTSGDTDYDTIIMQPETRDVEYYAQIPDQKEGTSVYFYITVIDSANIVYSFPENAPTELFTYSYHVTSHLAKLFIQPQAFNPRAGEKIPIEFASNFGNKAILRIYNSEGKLVITAQNIIVTDNDGITLFEWDGRDKNHKLLPIGLYICHLEVIDTGSGNKKTDQAPIVIGTPLN